MKTEGKKKHTFIQAHDKLDILSISKITSSTVSHKIKFYIAIKIELKSYPLWCLIIKEEMYGNIICN